jgi:5S rRNA maturation endonuclease (ribonuclease M5)
MIDVMGRIPNIKLYRPWKKEGEPFKWQAYVAGNPIIPTPLIHLTHNKIYIFEGEPDCYMAAAHGCFGITSGSASNHDYKKIFGPSFASTFKDKEIVIVTDADAVGEKAGKAMALQFIEVAKQVKIVNLNKSDTNPTGLDPQITHEYKGKLKRDEKDVTDFFRKNGFGDKAKDLFLALEERTMAFTDDRDRKAKQIFKVKLDESVHSKYFDNDGNTHLEIVANVSDIDDCIYKFPTKLCVSCKPLYDITMKNNNMSERSNGSQVNPVHSSEIWSVGLSHSF